MFAFDVPSPRSSDLGRSRAAINGTEAEVSPRISSLNQQLARGLREQRAHDAVIPHEQSMGSGLAS